MRLLCFIFSLCVILLSVSPCCSDKECLDECSTTNEQTSNTKHTGNDCKGCSPFFSCGTCAGFTVNTPAATTQVIASVKINRAYPPYQQPNFQDVLVAIWQPPQLV